MPQPGGPSRPRNQAEQENPAHEFPETPLEALTRVYQKALGSRPASTPAGRGRLRPCNGTVPPGS